MNLVLEAKSVSVRLGTRDLVRNVSLQCGSGEMVGLIGPNGAGKTTLMRVLAGLISHSGDVLLDGRPLHGLAGPDRARKLAYLPQNAPVHWPLSVREVVALGRIPHAAGGLVRGSENHAAVERALTLVELTSFAQRKCNQLSAGERARVLLARLLAVEAGIILADEPVAALDPAFQLHIMSILAAQAESGKAVIVVLHDLALAAQFCRRLILISNGQTVSTGSPAKVLTKTNLKNVYGIAPANGAGKKIPLGPVWRRVGSPPQS